MVHFGGQGEIRQHQAAWHNTFCLLRIGELNETSMGQIRQVRGSTIKAEHPASLEIWTIGKEAARCPLQAESERTEATLSPPQLGLSVGVLSPNAALAGQPGAKKKRGSDA